MIDREFFKRLYQFSDDDCCECCNNEVYEDNKRCKECLQCEECAEIDCECEKCKCGQRLEDDHPMCEICQQ